MGTTLSHNRGPHEIDRPRFPSKSRLVAATMRQSTRIVFVSPTRSNSCSCKTRSNFTCSL